MRTAFITNEKSQRNHKDIDHFERPERVSDSLKYINKNIKVEEIQSNEYSEEVFHSLYSKQYLDKIKRLSKLKRNGQIDGDVDTYHSTGTFLASTTAVYSNLTLLEKIIDETYNNGFALTRPPGHHSSCDHASGFCVFNTVALLAEECTKQGLRPMILDWDIHHGDGTQKFFEKRDDVFFCSIHRYGKGFYPGTGAYTEMGQGKGRGKTLNIPLSKGKTDNEYLYIIENLVIPAMKEFKPDILLISCGFDAHKTDPLAASQGMKLSSGCYGKMTSMVMKHCEKVLVSLEGGYSIDAISEGAVEVIKALNGIEEFETDDTIVKKNVLNLVNQIQKYRQKWL